MANKYILEDASLKEILAGFDIADFRYEKATNGAENTTVFIKASSKEYVLRVYRELSKTDEEISEEIEFINFLQKNGFPTVKFCQSISGNFLSKYQINNRNWQIVLMEKIEGKSINELDWCSDINRLREIAKLQAKLHLLGIDFARNKGKLEYIKEVTSSGVGKTLISKMSNIQNIPLKDTLLLNAVSEIKSIDYAYSSNLPSGYIHDDIDWNNLIISDSGLISIIDFGDLRFGPLISCLGSTLFCTVYSAYFLKQDPENLCKAYLKAYESVRTLSSQEIAEIIKPMELTIDLFLLNEILETKKPTARLNDYLNLKSIIRNLELAQN